MPANKVAVATILGAAGALTVGVLTPLVAVAQPNAAPVTVTIKQNGDYTASLCAADILEGRCQDGAKKGDTKTFTVKPPKNSPNIEVRVVVDGGGSTFQNFTADGAKLDIETGGNKQNPTATKVSAGSGHGEHGGQQPPAPQQPEPQKPQPQKPVKGTPTFFSAELDGKQEVPAEGQKVGDPDGRATALVEVKGDRITFALNWKNTSPLTLGHIHQGNAGQNGPVKVTLFGTAMPETVTSAAGQVVVDPALAEEIRKNPAGFYVNLHSTEFGGGAVRAQLKPLNKRVNPLDIIKGGKLRAFGNGKQEVPTPEQKAGDPDGQSVTFVQPSAQGGVDFSAAWVNIESPTLGHVHQGVKGQNGPVKITFFGTPIPANIFAVSGTASNVDKAVVDELKKNPAGFYSNLHTKSFAAGAVRGQFDDNK